MRPSPARPPPLCLRVAPCRVSSSTDPMHIVGFAWDGSLWHQIPVQVDQRDDVESRRHLPSPNFELPEPSRRDDDAVQDLGIHTASDPFDGLLVGWQVTPRADTDPMFSANDELLRPRRRYRQASPPSVASPTGCRGEDPGAGQGHRPARLLHSSATSTCSTAASSPEEEPALTESRSNYFLDSGPWTCPATRWARARSLPTTRGGSILKHRSLG